MSILSRGGRSLLALPIVASVLLSGGTAQAVVAIAPATYVPYLTGTDNYVYAADLVGSTTYVGGVVTQVRAPATGKTATRHSLFGYTTTTGAVTSFAPSFNGAVWGLAHSPDNNWLYVAGTFGTVNGVSARGLVRFSTATGALDPTFKARLNGSATAVAYVGGRIIVGGTFSSAGGAARTSLASLDPTTGTATSYVPNLGITGRVGDNAGATGVRRFAINPTASRLVAIGNFTTVAGASRWRAFMLDLGPASASLDSWNAPILKADCVASEPNYLWDVEFSPDGSYFAMVSTGYFGKGSVTSTVCDATSKWATISGTAAPVWVNYTGGDSLYGVAVSKDAVYVTGHQRWLDNPGGRDSAGPGAVSRPGIGAISPSTGRALSWNPTRSRGKGGKLLLMTPQGLLVGSDCAPPNIAHDVSSGANYYNGKYHPCLALAPGA